MENMKVTLRKAVREDRELLFQLNQKYLYEMSRYYDNPMDEKGIIRYGYLDSYFTAPDREAYLILANGELAGFVLLNRHSCTGRRPDHAAAEFTVFPKYRRRHIGSEAVKQLFLQKPGIWEVKYSEKNTDAVRFWTAVTERYVPEKIRLNGEETVLVFRVAAGKEDE